jgi:hypothetical protein
MVGIIVEKVGINADLVGIRAQKVGIISLKEVILYLTLYCSLHMDKKLYYSSIK